jgi:hypothetical protein
MLIGSNIEGSVCLQAAPFAANVLRQSLLLPQQYWVCWIMISILGKLSTGFSRNLELEKWATRGISRPVHEKKLLALERFPLMRIGGHLEMKRDAEQTHICGPLRRAPETQSPEEGNIEKTVRMVKGRGQGCGVSSVEGTSDQKA